MRVVTLFAHNPHPWTGGGTHTYLLRTPRQTTLIDAGEGTAEHVQAIAAELAGDPLDRVLVTHGHPDHITGAPALARRFPGASFAKIPWPDTDGKFAVAWHALKDEEVVDIGGEALWVLHTPGHSPDHACFFEPRSGVLFAGDLVRNGGTVAVLPSHGGNLRQYLQSLRRVLELRPRRILPGHGTPIDNPGALLRSYLSHRAMRRRQILDALGAGPRSVDDLLGLMYADLDPSLTDAAGESVLAHLIELNEEGCASPVETSQGARWALTR